MKNLKIFLRNALVTPQTLIRLTLAIAAALLKCIVILLEELVDCIPGYYKRFEK
jgi:hypothetical protein